jgi:hypothetical protein
VDRALERVRVRPSEVRPGLGEEECIGPDRILDVIGKLGELGRESVIEQDRSHGKNITNRL